MRILSHDMTRHNAVHHSYSWQSVRIDFKSRGHSVKIVKPCSIKLHSHTAR